jgi:cytochrome P450
MIAASDITAGLVSPLIASIIDLPRVSKWLSLEIDEFERQNKLSSPVASFDETNNTPYFIACVKETLRMFPPIPIILPRYVCKGGLSLNNTWIPEGHGDRRQPLAYKP